jgi:hypothetical protein
VDWSRLKASLKLVAETQISKQKKSSSPKTTQKKNETWSFDQSGRKVFYGDVHMHSAISDATGTPDEVLARAFIRGLDFAVLTDHDTVGGSRMLPSEYAEVAWTTDQFNIRQGFATLHAYEWTTPALPSGSGHKNVYFEEYGPTEPFTTGNGHPDTTSLYQKLRNEKAFAVPHHTPWTGVDWESFDEKIQRHFEVVSVHGGSDEPKGPIENRGHLEGMYAVDGYKKGLRFGLIAGSDGRDDILFNNEEGKSEYNIEETFFLKIIEESDGDLQKIVSTLETHGEITDDLSFLKLSYTPFQK